MRLKPCASAIAVLLVSSSFPATHVAAQTPPEPSIADAARLNREQKKVPAKPATVITDDTLKPSASPAAAPTSPAPPATNSNAPAPAGEPQQPGASREDTDRLKAEIAAVKVELKDKQSEVEISRRLLDLDRDAWLSKTDYSRDTAGKAKVDSEQADLQQKQDELEKLKTKLQSLAPGQASTPPPPKP